MTSTELDFHNEEEDVGNFRGHTIYPLIQKLARESAFELSSCLDVGCGRSPVEPWFKKFAGGDSKYIGVDDDPLILDEGRAKGLQMENPFTSSANLKSDLVIAKEVLEHLRPEDSPEFLSFCARNCRKLFAMTTPNFEYWTNLRSNDPEMRWDPDHFRHFKPDSSNGHDHRQEMTPENVATYLRTAFPSWHVRVFRAWPWDLVDLARDRSWRIYFKIFAVAWLPE